MPEIMPLDRLRAAWMHFMKDVKQHDVAGFLGVNSGRVNEACRAVEYAINNPRRVISLMDGDRGRGAPLPDEPEDGA